MPALFDAINRGDGKITVRGNRIVKNATEETTLIAFPHHVGKIQAAVVNVACLAIMTDVITEVEHTPTFKEPAETLGQSRLLEC